MEALALQNWKSETQYTSSSSSGDEERSSSDLIRNFSISLALFFLSQSGNLIASIIVRKAN